MDLKKHNLVFLIDTISCDTAGTQRQLIEIIRRLNKELFQPHIVCLHSSPWMEKNKLPCQVTVLGYRGFLKRNFPAVVWALRQFVQRHPAHLLQTFFEDSIFVAFLATLGLGKDRCLLLSSRRDMGLGGKRPWYHHLYPLALRLVDRFYDGIVCNGEEIKKWVMGREWMGPAKIRVIPNGIELPISAGVAPELFLDHSASVWIGLTANLTPVKRIDVFLRALARLKELRPQLSFRALVLGEGPERDALLVLAESLGIGDRVHFPGAVRDVSPFLHRVHIGVLTSDREGFSNAVLEYMAHGLPVVATAVGGNLELVDSTVGFCVPAGDSNALAEALVHLVGDPDLRARLGSAGRERVKSGYSWERSMEELEAYYSEMLVAHAVRR